MLVLDDVVVPSYPGKSTYQKSRDLVHPLLNALIEQSLMNFGWKTQGRVCDLVGDTNPGARPKTVDFYRELSDGRFVVAEVQFGNGGREGTDFAKFATLHQAGKLALAFHISFVQKTAITADQSLQTFETAVMELEKVGEMPVCVIGLSRADSKVVDLRELKGIVYPELLGGSGKGRKPLHETIARHMLAHKALAELDLSVHDDIIAQHACEHLHKALEAFQATVARAAACANPKLRDKLMAPIAEAAKNSYVPAEKRKRRTPAKVQAAPTLPTEGVAPPAAPSAPAQTPAAATTAARGTLQLPAGKGTATRVRKDSPHHSAAARPQRWVPAPAQRIIPANTAMRKAFLDAGAFQPS